MGCGDRSVRRPGAPGGRTHRCPRATRRASRPGVAVRDHGRGPVGQGRRPLGRLAPGAGAGREPAAAGPRGAAADRRSGRRPRRTLVRRPPGAAGAPAGAPHRRASGTCCGSSATPSRSTTASSTPPTWCWWRRPGSPTTCGTGPTTPVEVMLQATDHRRFRPRPVDPAHRHDVTDRGQDPRRAAAGRGRRLGRRAAARHLRRRLAGAGRPGAGRRRPRRQRGPAGRLLVGRRRAQRPLARRCGPGASCPTGCSTSWPAAPR